MIQGVEKKVHFPLSPQTRVQINELRDLHPLLHPKTKRLRKKFITARCQGFYSYVSFRTTRIRLSSTTTLLPLVVTKSPTTE